MKHKEQVRAEVKAVIIVYYKRTQWVSHFGKGQNNIV